MEMDMWTAMHMVLTGKMAPRIDRLRREKNKVSRRRRSALSILREAIERGVAAMENEAA